MSAHHLVTRQRGGGRRCEYGLLITAIILYLYGKFLSKKRTAQALAELLGFPVSGGTVATMTARTADGLEEFLT